MLPEQKINPNMLTADEVTFVDSFDEVLSCYMSAHSEFQIKHFLLNAKDFPTPSSRYHQCIREINARRNNLVNMEYQYNSLLIDLEISYEELKAKKPADGITAIYALQEKKQKIESNFTLHKLTELKKQASESMRELKILVQEAHGEVAKIPDEFKNEKGIPLREPSELETWTAKGIVEHKSPTQEHPLVDEILTEKSAQRLEAAPKEWTSTTPIPPDTSTPAMLPDYCALKESVDISIVPEVKEGKE